MEHFSACCSVFKRAHGQDTEEIATSVLKDFGDQAEASSIGCLRFTWRNGTARPCPGRGDTTKLGRIQQNEDPWPPWPCKTRECSSEDWGRGLRNLSLICSAFVPKGIDDHAFIDHCLLCFLESVSAEGAACLLIALGYPYSCHAQHQACGNAWCSAEVHTQACISVKDHMLTLAISLQKHRQPVA